jgi:hypothetical protein
MTKQETINALQAQRQTALDIFHSATVALKKSEQDLTVIDSVLAACQLKDADLPPTVKPAE